MCVAGGGLRSYLSSFVFFHTFVLSCFPLPIWFCCVLYHASSFPSWGGRGLLVLVVHSITCLVVLPCVLLLWRVCARCRVCVGVARGGGSYLSSLPFFLPYHGALFSSWGGRGILIRTCLACPCDNILLCHTLCIPYGERVQGVGGVWVWRGAGGVHTSPTFFFIPWCLYGFPYLFRCVVCHTMFLLGLVSVFMYLACAWRLWTYGHMGVACVCMHDS